MKIRKPKLSEVGMLMIVWCGLEAIGGYVRESYLFAGIEVSIGVIWIYLREIAKERGN